MSEQRGDGMEGTDERPEGEEYVAEDAADEDLAMLAGEASEAELPAAEAAAPDRPTVYQASEIPDGEVDATRLYLAEIGHAELLKAEEEVHFARCSRRGDAFCGEDCAFCTTERWKRRRQKRPVSPRALMIESNLRLVVKIARRAGRR